MFNCQHFSGKDSNKRTCLPASLGHPGRVEGQEVRQGPSEGEQVRRHPRLVATSIHCWLVHPCRCTWRSHEVRGVHLPLHGTQGGVTSGSGGFGCSGDFGDFSCWRRRHWNCWGRCRRFGGFGDYGNW